MTYPKLLLLSLLSILFFGDARAFSKSSDSAYSRANTIKFSAGVFRLALKNGQYPKGPVTQMGAHYERIILNEWRGGFGYSCWQTLEGLSDKSAVPITVTDLDHIAKAHDSGDLMRRTSYKMIDLYGKYSSNIYRKNHFVELAFGGFYCWGTNTYLNYYVHMPGRDDAQVFTYNGNKSYWGIAPSISYKYLLFNRICVGPEMRWRYFFNVWPVQTDYSLHLGVNF